MIIVGIRSKRFPQGPSMRGRRQWRLQNAGNPSRVVIRALQNIGYWDIGIRMVKKTSHKALGI